VTSLGVALAVFWSIAPIAIFILLRSRPGRQGWWFAVDIPAALAIDLVGSVLLSRLLFLDLAVWSMKGLWVVLGLALFALKWKRGWRPSWPSDLPRSAFAQALLSGLIVLGLSLTITRVCTIWDRQFHVPFVTSMRGQTSPMVTVYEPWKALHYHYGGNLLAASLQATSFGILHSSHALSLVHDICTFWLGVGTTLVLLRLGLKHTTLLILVSLAMIFAGPIYPLLGPNKLWYGGYSTTGYFSISLRPHMTVGMLGALPLLAVPLIRLTELESEVDWLELLVPFVALVPLLLIVDEFAIGVLGLGLGALWIFYPRVLATTRRQGVYVLGGLAAAMLFGFLVMNGTVAPGAPDYKLEFVLPRTPGFYSEPRPLTSGWGIRYFLADLGPIIAVLVGGAWLLIRNRQPRHVGALILYVVVALVSILLFSTLAYAGSGRENHRFIIVLMFYCPLFAAAFLAPRPDSGLKYAGFPELAMTLVVFLGAASGLEWYGGPGNNDCKLGEVSVDFYKTNCREEVGAGLVTEPTTPMYFDPAIQYLYIGCRPAYMVGPVQSLDGHDLKVGKAQPGIAALKEFANEPRFQPASENIRVVCARESSEDPANDALQIRVTLVVGRGGLELRTPTRVLHCIPAEQETKIVAVTQQRHTHHGHAGRKQSTPAWRLL
jgi:hypothetical protein